MKFRPLGKTGINVSEIGFGAWGIGGQMWKGSDDKESMVALRKAVDEAAAQRRCYASMMTVTSAFAAPEQAVVAAFERMIEGKATQPERSAGFHSIRRIFKLRP